MVAANDAQAPAPSKRPHRDFGERLQRFRLDLGYANVESWTSLLGVSPRTIEKYEQGRSMPTGEVPWRLLALLGPERFASLLPHVTDGLPAAPEGPLPEATRVVLVGSPAERLRELLRPAEGITRELETASTVTAPPPPGPDLSSAAEGVL